MSALSPTRATTSSTASGYDTKAARAQQLSRGLGFALPTTFDNSRLMYSRLCGTGLAVRLTWLAHDRPDRRRSAAGPDEHPLPDRQRSVKPRVAELTTRCLAGLVNASPAAADGGHDRWCHRRLV